MNEFKCLFKELGLKKELSFVQLREVSRSVSVQFNILVLLVNVQRAVKGKPVLHTAHFVALAMPYIIFVDLFIFLIYLFFCILKPTEMTDM